jgi:glycosyltransferase involved in cell wall biosynthesis
MASLSLVVIARNEADRIGRCLESAAFIADRLVIESGSVDGTAAAARAYGARVLETDWPGFGAQRNRGFAETLGEWLLFLDADEWLEAESVDAIGAFVARPGAAVAASFPFQTRWLGHELRRGRWHPGRKVRLIRRGAGRWSDARVHERLEVEGPVARLEAPIRHDPYRSLGEHLQTIDRYATAAAEEVIRRGVVARRRDVLLRPPAHFLKALLVDGGLLDGPAGIAVAALGATSVGLKWTRARSR